MQFLILLALCAAPAFARVAPRVVGGDTVTDDTKFPWQGSLQFTSGSHTCGCSLVAARWAISAAHCVGSSVGSYRMRFGSLDRGSGGQIVTPSAITRHPGWVNDGSQGFPNDVAVIAISSAVDISTPQVTPVKLAPSDSADYVANECHISGWGRLYGGGPLPNELQEARIDVLSQADCISRWGSYINDGHICIMGYNGGTTIGACNGDSGGPLSCLRDGEWVVAGVTSWVRSGCLTTFPSVYARVSYYNTWITGITGPL